MRSLISILRGLGVLCLIIVGIAYMFIGIIWLPLITNLINGSLHITEIEWFWWVFFPVPITFIVCFVIGLKSLGERL